MKRAAEKQTRRGGESDTDHQEGPEQPAKTREGEDPPLKKAKQQSQPSSDPTPIAEGQEDSLNAPETATGKGRSSSNEATLPHQAEVDEAPRVAGRRPSASVEGVVQMAATEFPAQLMSLLRRNVAPDALWFMEGGEAIGLNRDLIGDVLNEHFRGMKFNSLVRNLNRWGFRRISHPSLRDKDRGYHHLLFQRENPDLIHRMRRDSSATDVVRQLDLADGAPPREEPTSQESKSSRVSESTERPPTTRQAVAHPPQLPERNIEHRQSLPSRQQGLLRGTLSTQQLMQMQGVALQQQLEWQRQQSSLALQLGALHSGAWGGPGSWNVAQQTLPAASALAFGMPQHQQQHAEQAAARRQAMASLATTHRTSAHIPPSASDPPVTSQETEEQTDEEEGDSKPRATRGI